MYSLCNLQYQHVIIHVQYLIIHNQQVIITNMYNNKDLPLPFWDTCTVTQGGDSSLLTTQSGTLVNPEFEGYH